MSRDRYSLREVYAKVSGNDPSDKNTRMSLKVRAVLVVIIGTVLGLTVSFGSRLVDNSLRSVPVAEPDAATIIADVIARVREEYVDRIDESTLIESAIRGIVQDLDTHSRYLDSTAYDDIRISTTGHYAGVGLDVALHDGLPTVVAPIGDTPAERAGILPGDVVVAVDGDAVTATNFQAMVGKMRGIAGTEVTIDIRRGADAVPLRFALVRAAIEVKTVRSAELGDGFGYIRLTGFSENTATELTHAAQDVERTAGRPLRGLVLDLRNNPGGVLDAAIEVADLFLAEGLIVRGIGRIQHAQFEHRAHRGDMLETVPVVVVVNAGSASASEIVAGALKDQGRARIVGEQTYGKGSVQTVMPLGQGRAIKITTSRYVLPAGETLNGAGIEPDILVRNEDPARQFDGSSSKVALNDDRQLLRALRVIGYDPIALSQAP
jgi:carboxyl-terminal processing protease